MRHLSLLKVVLAREEVHSHGCGLLQELLALVHEVGWDLPGLDRSITQGELVLDGSALGLCPGVGLDVMLAHEVEQLAWNLLKYFLRQKVGTVFELIEGYKLDDIGSHVLAIGHRVECFLIAIQHLH